MGCLNAGQSEYTNGNIHLSGPCNRSCYFCVGQHMMALDGLNVLDTWPLPGLDEFLKACQDKKITNIDLTGTNTDPFLYKHLEELTRHLRMRIPGVKLGVRTNGAIVRYRDLRLFDHGSISIPTFKKSLYKKIMGSGEPPNLKKIVKLSGWPGIKVNMVLCPEVSPVRLLKDIDKISRCGVNVINLREPYGQPRRGDPLKEVAFRRTLLYGMPVYSVNGTMVVYWDVHHVQVDSVNLYASGRVSTDYAITRGHAEGGLVLDQTHFQKSGRIREQWVKV